MSTLKNIVVSIMEYAAAPLIIPNDVYELIQIFLNTIDLEFISTWDLFWQNESTGSMKLLHENLLKAFDTNSTTDDTMRKNVILVKLCLMTFYNYQQALKKMDKNELAKKANRPIDTIILVLENESQVKIMNHLLILFKREHVEFYPNDEHFAELLNRFFNWDDKRFVYIQQMLE